MEMQVYKHKKPSKKLTILKNYVYSFERLEVGRGEGLF